MRRVAGVGHVAMVEQLLPCWLGWPFVPGRSQPLVGPLAIWKLVALMLPLQVKRRTQQPMFVDTAILLAALIAPFLAF